MAEAEPGRTSRRDGPRYESGDEIARGGMGRVVEATDHLLGRVVAVKEALTDDPETLRRFARETRITARLEHPSIVPLYDAGGGDGTPPYYVMRRVSGKPLAELVDAADTLDNRLALLPHMIACAQAIAHAHKRGVIHRDLKPTNILVGELGETVVIDWGLAKVIGESDDDTAGGPSPLAGDSLRTRIGTVAGTPGFMAPEQARGDTHGMGADVWALGACLYYVLARRPPHATHETSGDDLVALTAGRPVTPVATFARGVPAELAAIVDTALAFRVEDRYPDAAALAEDLQRFQAGQLVASHDYTLGERIVRWAKRNRSLLATLVLAGVAITVISGIAITRVIDARNRAQAAAATADAERRRAEAERHRADDRADGELIARARSVLQTDPARAVAIMKQLPATSTRREEALAVVRSARMFGGSVWGVRGSDHVPVHVDLNPSGTYAYVLRREGVVEVFPLDRPASVVTRIIGREQRLVWFDDRRLVVVGGQETSLLDPTTDQREEVPVGPLSELRMIGGGRGIAWSGSQIVRVDFARGTATPVTTPFSAKSFEASGDGNYIALVHDKGAAIIDANDRVVASLALDSKSQLLIRGPGARFVMNTDNSLWEVDAGATAPVFAPIPRPTGPITSVKTYTHPVYVGDKLYLRDANGLALVNQTRAHYIFDSKSMMNTPIAVSHDQLALLTHERDLNLIDGGHARRLRFPTAVVSPRLAGRHGVHYLVVAGRGQTLIYDLHALAPRHLTSHRNFYAGFATDETLVAGREFGFDWIDVATGKATPSTLEGKPCCPSMAPLVLAGTPMLFAAGLNSIEALYAFAAPYTDGKAYYGDDMRAAHGAQFVLADRGELFTFGMGEQPRSIATFKTPVTSLRAFGRTFMLVTNDELVIGDMITGAITTRQPYKLVGSNVNVAMWKGRLVVADGPTLRWFGETSSIATFDREINTLLDVVGGLLVVLEGDSGVHYVRLDVDPIKVSPIGLSLISGNKDFALVGSGDGMSWVDIPSLVKAEIPIVSKARHSVSLSPNGRVMLELIGQEMWLWDLPLLAGDMFAAARETTNLLELPTAVVWPWQVPNGN